MLRKLILALCLLATPASAAINYVGGTTSGVNDPVQTLTYTTHVGNIAVVAVGDLGAGYYGCVTPIVADSAGNSYTSQGAQLDASNFMYFIFTSLVVNAANTTTVTINGCLHAYYGTAAIAEYSGAVAINAPTTYSTATSPEKPSITRTLSAANNWIVAVNFNGSYPYATNGTIRQQVGPSAALDTKLNLMDNTTGTASPVTCSLSAGITNPGMIAIELVAPPPPVIIPGHHRRTISKGVQ